MYIIERMNKQDYREQYISNKGKAWTNLYQTEELLQGYDFGTYEKAFEFLSNKIMSKAEKPTQYTYTIAMIDSKAKYLHFTKMFYNQRFCKLSVRLTYNQ